MNLEQIPAPSECTLTDHSIADQQVAHGTPREQLHLRNHDIIEGYDLDIRLEDDQQCAIERHLYLQPGADRGLGELVSPGNWQVTVSLDANTEMRSWCSLGPANGHTAVIECGNGVVTVRQRG